MQVETFEVEEVTGESHPEVQAEAVELVGKLGLTGQLSLIGSKADTATKTRAPYRTMTGDERFVYEAMCPEKCRVENYSAGPIPLRVLQVVAHCREIGIFHHLDVWYARQSLVKDPVLVGYLHDGSDYRVPNPPYYLARWGEVLDEFPALFKQALAKRRSEVVAALQQIKAEAAAKLAAITELPSDAAAFASMDVPYARL